jgi:hypothetical protein
LTERISKLIKGINIFIDLYRQVVQDYQDTQTAQAAREAREKHTKRWVVGGGLMTVEEARHKITERAEKKANSEARRAEKRRKKALIG